MKCTYSGMKNRQLTPVFIVGCPRSGTTLLQSLLSAHPEVCSFPESHFFHHLLSSQNVCQKWLGIAPSNIRVDLEKFVRLLNDDSLMSLIPKRAICVEQYAQSFVNVLDAFTLKSNNHIWIEKPPIHLRYIKEIECFYDKPKFIHIIRSGIDVVSSLYEVTNKYPEEWGGARSINACISRWLSDVRISLSYFDQPEHHMIPYEYLVKDTSSAVRQLCTFLGIVFDPSMLVNYGSMAEAVSLGSEPWKDTVSDAIRVDRGKKKENLFDMSQRDYIAAKLSVINSSKSFERLYDFDKLG